MIFQECRRGSAAGGAGRDGELRQRLLDAGIGVLYKPLEPLALRQLLQRAAAARA